MAKASNALDTLVLCSRTRRGVT